MSNVVSLYSPAHVTADRALDDVVDLFANRRRTRRDAFWLKENAELLQILLATQHAQSAPDLSAYAGFVSSMVEEMRFFPQYYRFYLSIALDLAALGFADVPVRSLADLTLQGGYMGAELSDSHRAEAGLLMARAGQPLAHDQGLVARLEDFCGQSALFCLPNRSLAYALTHSVFHASDYGRVPIARNPARRLALVHAGIIAWMEDNLDLLAEVAVALVQSGEAVPQVWQDAILTALAEFSVEQGAASGPFDDAYHEFLVLNWAAHALGGTAFAASVPSGARLFRRQKHGETALRDLSLALLDMGGGRSADWAMMRWRIWPKLAASARARIEAVEALPEFDGFFRIFARAGQAGI